MGVAISRPRENLRNEAQLVHGFQLLFGPGAEIGVFIFYAGLCRLGFAREIYVSPIEHGQGLFTGCVAQRVQLSTAALHHAQVYHLPGGVQSPGADGAGVHKAGQVLSMLSRVEACGLEKAGNKDEKLLPGEEPVRAEGAVLIAQGKAGGV